MNLLQALDLRLKEPSDIRAGSEAFDGPPSLKSSDPAPVLRPDTPLILDYVPNIKSNDCNKFVSVISLFIREAESGPQRRK